MKVRIGIRREDKNRWERRAPLTPAHVKAVSETHNIEVYVQPSNIRVFIDGEYAKAGAKISEDLSQCRVVLGIKEMPESIFSPGRTYAFFSHTIKGQKHNMPMLRRLMDLGCQLIDYEKVTDREGKRILFFGRHAGMAGMIDVLWALGRRLKGEGIRSPFEKILQAHRYRSLDDAKSAVATAGLDIADAGLPRGLSPFICGFTGYGNVSIGAQEIFDLFPVEVIQPEEVFAFAREAGRDRRTLFKVVFREEDVVVPADPTERFQLKEYYEHPEKYVSDFDRYVSCLTLLANCIYWDNRYPRLVTKSYLKALWERQHGRPRLRVIGDFSCDVEGAIEATLKITTPDSPAIVYDPLDGSCCDGMEGRGPVVIAVDNLPCELPLDASQYFSDSLVRFLLPIARENYSGPFEKCGLPEEVRKAVILWNGKLTPSYLYLSRHLDFAKTPRAGEDSKIDRRYARPKHRLVGT